MDWTAPPAEPRLPRDEIHLWRASLDSERSLTRRLEAALTDDELARASRFVFPRDRDRFMTGRGILRDILARYLGRPAAAIRFMYEPAGKPRLHLRDGDPLIRFNLSHSHGLAVFAVSHDREVGVDVEANRANVAGDDIAERFFSVRELAELRSLPPDRRDEGFLLCWSRKEAYIKARGAGLGIPLDSFDVSLTPGMPAELSSADDGRWTLGSFRPADGYAGAVVAEGRDWGLRLWDWTSAT